MPQFVRLTYKDALKGMRMPLGDKIKQAREQRGWTQQQLSEHAGVRRALISELETGKKEDTTGENLRRLAEALNTSVDYLVGKRNDPKRSPAEWRSLDGTATLPVTIHSEGGVDSYDYSTKF
jgi:putative transcriptional regulator